MSMTDAELAVHLAEVAGRLLIEVRAAGVFSPKALGKAGEGAAKSLEMLRDPAKGMSGSLEMAKLAFQVVSDAAARGALDDLLMRQLDLYGFAHRLDRVALVGFSQGATMVFDAIASGRWPVAAAWTRPSAP